MGKLARVSGVGAALLGTAVLLLLASIESEQFTIAMSEAEVTSILGPECVALRFRSELELREFAADLGMDAPPDASITYWDAGVHVMFSKYGTVLRVREADKRRRFLGKLGRCLHVFWADRAPGRGRGL
jgi:hypothetical protein